MARYDVAIWLWWDGSWPQVVVTVSADTPFDAILRVLHSRNIVHAAKVAVHPVKDNRCWRWWRVVCLEEGFSYQEGGCAPLGVPAAPALLEQG